MRDELTLKDLAVATGHKIIGGYRAPTQEGIKLYVYLDGKLMLASEARSQLESQYNAANHKAAFPKGRWT